MQAIVSEPRVLAIRVPAECGFKCTRCLSPDHNQGDVDAVFEAAVREAKTGKYDLVYITSDGDTGRYDRYMELVNELQQYVGVASLSNTFMACRPLMWWLEISDHYDRAVHSAVTCCRGLGVEPVLATVWDGKGAEPDRAAIANKFGVDLVLQRKQRTEGRATYAGGVTRMYVRPGYAPKWFIPIAAYEGMEGIGAIQPLKCIDTYGNEVDRFRGSSVRPQ